MSDYTVKLWTHQQRRIVWAIVKDGKPVQAMPHTTPLMPPAAMVERAAELNATT